MVPIPDEVDEDARQCTRERTELVSERVGLTNRIGAVLATLGIDNYNPLLKNRRRRLVGLRTGLDAPIPPHALAKIEWLLSRLELVLDQIAALENDRDAVAEKPALDEASRMIQQLCTLRGIGVQSATVLIRGAFVRRFANGKALGTYAGLTATLTAAAGSSVNKGSGKPGTGGFAR
jgi:transposase